MGHAVRLGAEGRLEVTRSAPPESADALRRTIKRLRAATGTGAVEIVAATDDGERVELVLAFAGRPPSAPLLASDAAPILRSVAVTLTDLHARGIAHGAVAVDHVLVDAQGAVRLCGFGTDAGSIARDVLAFGALVRDLLDGDDASDAASALRAVAVRCTVDDDASRPTMAAVTASLSSTSSRPITMRPTSPTTSTRRRWPIAIAAGVVVVVALLTALPRKARAELPVAATTSTTSTVVRTTTTRPWPMARELSGKGGRWQFEGRGIALVGAWTCAERTPAIVRPDGSVWIVDAWPRDGDVAARYVTTVHGALGAHAESLGDCDDLVVETADGPIRPALAT